MELNGVAARMGDGLWKQTNLNVWIPLDKIIANVKDVVRFISFACLVSHAYASRGYGCLFCVFSFHEWWTQNLLDLNKL